MFRMIRATLLMFCVCAELPAATIVLVRHADRSSAMTGDAPLSPAGEQRASDLAFVLKDANIARIFVTEVRRTSETAAPIAGRLHLKPVIIPHADTGALIAQLRRLGEDETVLVVAHGDTIPLIIDRVGGGPAAPLADSEYDRLTILVTGTGKTRVVTLRYGKPTE